MLDTIGKVFHFIGSWAEPLWTLSPDVKDPIVFGLVFTLGALIAIGAWKSS